MPLAVVPILFALAILVTAVSGVWLMLNARSVAALFRDRDVIEPGPGRPRRSRKAVIVALVLFNLGWMSAVAIQWASWEGETNEMVVPDPY
ncbi:hypothetical protein B5C34_13000 [Pacificimonas flava]|uniref:Uncharacterized protein n=2 Tax=Pacificimonas TaxID=1960290 RepID=A0A219B7X4_9SPHN|nr:MULTISPECIES: hypothetical protein [Pacificimonas]MBZ6378412.1 hypothetical protein [Pacificimonas aurantium]OWV34284.1 hypothetical protein B5C34_13000 [Pacificimonas flava]